MLIMLEREIFTGVNHRELPLSLSEENFMDLNFTPTFWQEHTTTAGSCSIGQTMAARSQTKMPYILLVCVFQFVFLMCCP